MHNNCSKISDIIYGNRYISKPSTAPCSTKFVQWATLLPVQGKDTASLVDSFQFEHIDASNGVQQKVSTSYWYLLIQSYTIFGVRPPTLSITKHASFKATNLKSPRHNKKRKHYKS